MNEQKILNNKIATAKVVCDDLGIKVSKKVLTETVKRTMQLKGNFRSNIERVLG